MNLIFTIVLLNKYFQVILDMLKSLRYAHGSMNEKLPESIFQGEEICSQIYREMQEMCSQIAGDLEKICCYISREGEQVGHYIYKKVEKICSQIIWEMEEVRHNYPSQTTPLTTQTAKASYMGDKQQVTNSCLGNLQQKGTDR